MSWIAARMPGFARHGAILREAWTRQNEADRTAKPRSDHQFLPAALEIMETPPSPGLRWLMLSLCGLFVIALAWAIVGRVDVVAVASGKTIPSGNAKIVQSIEIGGVRAIHVRNGQFVRRGQLLIELDPTLASADEAQSTQTLQSARIIQARNDALLAHLEGRPARFVAPAGTSARIARTERAFVRTAIAEYEAQAAGIRQQRAEKTAQLAGAEAEIAKLREALPFLERQMKAREELTIKGYYSKLKLLEYEQARAEHIRNIDVQMASAQGARAALGTLDAQARQLRENFGKVAVTDLAEANDKAGLAVEELRKTERRRQYQELRSPVDGVVQQLAVTTVGGVVQPAQALMVIVPCTSARVGAECSSAVEVETFVQNKDIGFVRVGQRAAVKLEAFNFTDYGLIEGEVETISRDAVERAGDPRGEEKREPTPSLVYAARIRLRCDPGSGRSPLCDRVQPGMSVQAEIMTGQRRIIQYLLSPISQTVSEAGRER